MEIAFILPLSERPERNRACLESLARTLPPGWHGEIVLIADREQTAADLLALLPPRRCYVHLHPTPHQTAALNAAAAEVTAPILGFLDPGVVFLRGWLPPMLRLLRTDARAGCIGNVHRESYSGLIDHAGIGFDANGLPVAAARSRPLLPRDVADRHAAVSLTCSLMRRTLFEQLGGFDADFRHPFLAGVDFCLRAAESGFRHYVANRSVVYRHDDAPSISDAPDLPLYRERWGERARLCFQRRRTLRNTAPDTSFSAEHWEMAREQRRLLRREIGDTNAEGRRYLTKHWFRPWRYNYTRLTRALGLAFAPAPTALPPVPGHPDDATRPDDGWLFEPPPQP